MQKARDDGKPLVYIGFGSIVVPKPRALTRSIAKAVLKSMSIWHHLFTRLADEEFSGDVRAIISKGWSARLDTNTEPEIELPPECYSVSGQI
jgi:sterol 3beta-glucosyltransferase